MRIQHKIGKTLVVAVLFSAFCACSAKAQTMWESYGTTTTTEKNSKGEVTTTTTVSENLASSKKSGSTSGGSSGSTSGGSSDTSSGASNSADKTGSSSSEKKDEFSGVYNSSQIIPNEMAIFCEVSGEDFLKDASKRNACINKIALKINNKDSTIRNEGITEYGYIKYAELKTMMGQATTKNASIANYQEVQNSVGKAISDTKTEHEDNVGIASSVSVSTDVINTMRDLLVERLKYEAISGIASIDPEVIKEIEANGEATPEEKQKGGGSISSATETSDSTEITYTVENPKTTEWRYKSENKCEREVCTGEGDDITNLQCTTQSESCPDGTYITSEGSVICLSGNCNLIKDEDISDDIPCENSSLTEISGYRLVKLSEGICNDGTKEVKCPDGRYKVGDQNVACSNGVCSGCLDEVVITASKTSENTSSAESSKSSSGDKSKRFSNFKI